MAKIFISYSSAEEDLAKYLTNWIEKGFKDIRCFSFVPVGLQTCRLERNGGIKLSKKRKVLITVCSFSVLIAVVATGFNLKLAS